MAAAAAVGVVAMEVSWWPGGSGLSLDLCRLASFGDEYGRG